MKYEFKNLAPNPHFAGVYDIPPQDVLDAANSGNSSVRLIDVREVSEYHGELGHAPKSELLVLSTLPEKIQNLDKDQTIIFICRSGGRSAQAAAFAKQHGFTDVYNMLGGMLFWNQLQLPTET